MLVFFSEGVLFVPCCFLGLEPLSESGPVFLRCCFLWHE